ncbi:S66 peptidase family protein [Virgisporangium aurantiacum]|uniref:Muramoyltetrapeptide carboxypeptidase n=1 Tax=Virgisporangium aurantiacum TaxID=175570 RepID=A0A8J4E0D1_9ACTN|nr:LD-carboxypeptidase [Virgisporangium aurantiacum]GIJ56578.1 muramoyltetrapeptide carboxypeptidase [Virgisporangium aurantiacum]
MGSSTGVVRPAVLPAVLREGDRVRVVAPGGPPTPARLDRGVRLLRGWGLAVEVAPHVHDRWGYLAGRDADRLADLNAALRDPGVRGVFAARGGYGCQRIVDGVDTDAARRDPKVVVGFSDITSLHGKLWRDARLATFYGPGVAWNDVRTGPESAESLRAAVMTTAPVVVHRDPREPSAAVSFGTRATGPLLGGALTMLGTSVGAGDLPDFAGAILFIEDVDEPPYSYDRMLTHLRRVGALAHLAGVAVGQLVGAGPPGADQPGAGSPGELDAPAVLRDRLGDLGVPVLGGLRLGHGTGQLTVPLGVPATIDVAAGTLTVEPGVR